MKSALGSYFERLAAFSRAASTSAAPLIHVVYHVRAQPAEGAIFVAEQADADAELCARALEGFAVERVAGQLDERACAAELVPEPVEHGLHAHVDRRTA